MKSKLLILSLLLFFSEITRAQESDKFNIYVFKNRYNQSGQEYIKNKAIFKGIDILGAASIDPKNQGIINFNKIQIDLVKLYPNKMENGTLCLDIENTLYSNLQKFGPGSSEYSKSITELSKMLDLVKALRPNVKVGIYGLPYRVFYKSQNFWNSNGKLDPILKKSDIIFPSLYILFADNVKGTVSNNNYWKQNLDNAFSYAERLKKPVIPFIWYMLNSGKNGSRDILLSKQELGRYINFIKQYTSNSSGKVQGIVWWEPSATLFQKLTKNRAKSNNTDIFIDYMKSMQ